MTREEAIEYLHKLFMQAEITDEYGDMDDTEPYETAIDMAVEALKFRGAYEIAVKAANKAFENRWTQWVEWIPCSDRLPEEKQVVLITNGKSHVRCGQYQRLLRDSDPTQWWWKNKTIETVMAWMPLPTPFFEPTQQQEGEDDD